MNKYILIKINQNAGRILENPQVWSHRGVNTNVSNQNTSQAILLAKQNGFKGSEIDIFYDDDKKRFIVSHDYSYNLKNDKLLYLDEIIQLLGDHYLWLDFKNLNNSNVNESIQYLNDHFSEYKNQIIIESVSQLVSQFTEAGFFTSYWIFGIS